MARLRVNEEVFKKASLPSIESILLQVQLRWAGYVTRVEDVRMSKAVFLATPKKESAIVVVMMIDDEDLQSADISVLQQHAHCAFKNKKQKEKKQKKKSHWCAV